MTDTSAPVSAEAPAPDLVERLRKHCDLFNQMDNDEWILEADRYLREAADIITALRAEVQGWKNVNKLLASQVEAQRREVERLTAALLGEETEHSKRLMEVDQLRAEVERLRTALHRIGLPLAQITYCRDGHEEAVLLARAALKEPRT